MVLCAPAGCDAPIKAAADSAATDVVLNRLRA
jgi:hypothetical protein